MTHTLPNVVMKDKHTHTISGGHPGGLVRLFLCMLLGHVTPQREREKTKKKITITLAQREVVASHTLMHI